jgi:starch synthase
MSTDDAANGLVTGGGIAVEVVFVASEAVPFAKTGGLADVAGALPRALEDQGHRAALFLPCYRRARAAGVALEDTDLTLQIPIGARVVEGRVRRARLPGSGVVAYLIDQPGYFDRDGLYGTGTADYDDNCERFVFFQRAVLETIRALRLRPDVIHGNDWQTGLIPAYVRTLYKNVPELASAGTLLTIHNLGYLGLFRHWEMALTGLDWHLYNSLQLELDGKLCFMKAGLVFADLLSTVSPTYAREIQAPRYGNGLDGLLRDRHADLYGIVNGIDTGVWSPLHEPMIAERYDAMSVVQGKARCKSWLQGHAGLERRPDVPLFAQVGRLDPHKGWDLLAEVADRLLARDAQLVVLGVGHPKYHAMLEDLARRHPRRCTAFLGFDDALAHQIEAGVDLFLMPSLFEPCGLNQLYSLAHGTVPIVRATGGLADTVIDAHPRTLAEGTATGFAFTDPTAEALWQAIERALTLWPDRDAWLKLMRSGMSQDWSWDRSAREYTRLYEETARRVRSRNDPQSVRP